MHLRCSDVSKVNSIYLPVGESINNYKLSIVATVTDKITKTKSNTIITTEVCHDQLVCSPSSSGLLSMLFAALPRSRVESSVLFWLSCEQVRPENSSSTVQELQSAVVDSVAQLQQQGLLSGENLGQMFQSVSDMLNENNDDEQKEDREKVGL